jgi:hypothetical protein
VSYSIPHPTRSYQAPQTVSLVDPAEMEEIERDISRWGRGSVFIEVNENGRRLLRILPQP